MLLFFLIAGGLYGFCHTVANELVQPRGKILPYLLHTARKAGPFGKLYSRVLPRAIANTNVESDAFVCIILYHAKVLMLVTLCQHHTENT